MGFFDDLAKNAALWGAVQASKDKNGKTDPYKAAGIAAGMGNFSFSDRLRLGAMLGSQGAFDTNTDDDYSAALGYSGTDNSWKDFCEDGDEYDVDPEDYDSQEEYEEALTEVKDSWRDECEDGTEYGIDPEDYDSEEEYEEALTEAKYSWRDECEDGTEYGIDPEDYDSEEEYEEALMEAEYSCEDACEDDTEHGIDSDDYDSEEEYVESEENTGITLSFQVSCPALDKLNAIKREDYANERRYQAAYILANEFHTYSDEEHERKEKERCRFIVEDADHILAANYFSYKYGFLYAQAIKDHFKLPCSLPEEEETREMEFAEIMVKIARYDIPLSLEIWAWCLQQFLPYVKYDDYADNDLSMEVIDRYYSFPDGYIAKLVHYMDENPEFYRNFMAAGSAMSNGISRLIVGAIRERKSAMAEAFFRKELDKANGQWKEINRLTGCMITDCKSYEECESMEWFRDRLLPIIKEIDIGMVQDEIPEWEKEIAEYINRVEDNDKYEAWREKTEAVRKQRREEWLQSVKQAQTQAHVGDKTIYTYCGVLLPFSNRAFSYRTEDDTIQIGDGVIVPVGRDNEEMEGKVVSVGKYARAGVPYPVENTKFILKKI